MGAQYVYSHQDISRLVEEPACVRQLALRQSAYRQVGETFWRLYVYDRELGEIDPYEAAMCDPRWADR